MSFEIRLANVHDADAIAHLHVQSWLETYRMILPDDLLAALDVREKRQMWFHLIDGGAPVHVAEYEGSMIGFANGGPFREEHMQIVGELYCLHVARPYQSNGVGRALFATVSRQLAQNEELPFAAWVVNATLARRFYNAMGGTPLITRYRPELGIKGAETMYKFDSAVENDGQSAEDAEGA